ncbi:MAG: 2-hydroxymuconic semialdehyde dehydrogenase, partial [Flavobacteriales bacterium CG_4_10_14_0_2_um_filter_32_8]
MLKIKNFINGEFVEPVSGNYLDNYDPSKGEVYSLIPDSDATDVELAVKAAKAAFPSWSVTP